MDIDTFYIVIEAIFAYLEKKVSKNPLLKFALDMLKSMVLKGVGSIMKDVNAQLKNR
jgi:hypothetical protein